MVNGWKVTAIIFIILFVLVTTALVYLTYLGVGIVNRENECSINICDGYDAFYYDDWERMCYSLRRILFFRIKRCQDVLHHLKVS